MNLKKLTLLSLSVLPLAVSYSHQPAQSTIVPYSSAVEKKVLTIVARQTGNSESKLNLTMDLKENLGINSLDMHTMALEIQRSFDLSPTDITKICKQKTIGDIVDLVNYSLTAVKK